MLSTLENKVIIYIKNKERENKMRKEKVSVILLPEVNYQIFLAQAIGIF